MAVVAAVLVAGCGGAGEDGPGGADETPRAKTKAKASPPPPVISIDQVRADVRHAVRVAAVPGRPAFNREDSVPEGLNPCRVMAMVRTDEPVGRKTVVAAREALVDRGWEVEGDYSDHDGGRGYAWALKKREWDIVVSAAKDPVPVAGVGEVSGILFQGSGTACDAYTPAPAPTGPEVEPPGQPTPLLPPTVLPS